MTEPMKHCLQTIYSSTHTHLSIDAASVPHHKSAVEQAATTERLAVEKAERQKAATTERLVVEKAAAEKAATIERLAVEKAAAEKAATTNDVGACSTTNAILRVILGASDVTMPTTLPDHSPNFAELILVDIQRKILNTLELVEELGGPVFKLMVCIQPGNGWCICCARSVTRGSTLACALGLGLDTTKTPGKNLVCFTNPVLVLQNLNISRAHGCGGLGLPWPHRAFGGPLCT
eukprot:COSAG02_NODE_583_length_20010_cov_4.434584_9_plen_234_part_00